MRRIIKAIIKPIAFLFLNLEEVLDEIDRDRIRKRQDRIYEKVRAEYPSNTMFIGKMGNQEIIKAVRDAGYKVTKRLVVIKANEWVAAHQAVEDGSQMFLIHFTNGKPDAFSSRQEVI